MPEPSASLPIVSLSPADARLAAPPAPVNRAPAALAQEEYPPGRRQPLHGPADRGVGPGNRLRKRQVPQSHGVLEPADRHVHDHGQHLHPAVRFLLGAQGQDRGARNRRARARGRGRGPARSQTCRDHFGHPRRPGRRRGRALLSLGAGGARKNRRGRRSAHPRLHRQARRRRARRRVRARSVQPQHRNRAPALSRRARSQKRIPLDARTAGPREAA